MMRQRILRLRGTPLLLLLLALCGAVLLGWEYLQVQMDSLPFASARQSPPAEGEIALFAPSTSNSMPPLRASSGQETAAEPLGSTPSNYVWHIETVEGAGDVGEYTSLALNAAGWPRISYCRLQPSSGYCTALQYASYDGNTWITETIESGWDVGHGTSLALDTSDRPHIAYSGENVVRYAYYDGGAWIKQTVGSGCCPSLVLDPVGQPHIAYYSAGLRYAYHDGTAWHLQTVETGTCSSASLELDSAGQPHISYISGAPATYLKYAHHDGTAWQVETVTFTGKNYAPTSLAADSSGRPHIAYSMGEPMAGGWQMYAHYDGTTWHTAVVEEHSGSGALVLDSEDCPHIIYNGAGLRYAYLDGTAWVSQTVDPTDPVADISLVLDAASRTHVSYYGWNNGDLKYAYQCVPISSATVTGPTHWPLGVNALYDTTYAPPSVSLPISLTWNNGAHGLTAPYSWTLIGTFAVAVTTTNPCSQVADVLSVTIFCQPLEGILLDGPGTLLIGQQGTYRAAAEPLTTSLPITFSWDNGALGPVAFYSWAATGTYTLTVTATSVCGDARTATRSIRVLTAWPYHRYLPMYWVAARQEQ